MPEPRTCHLPNITALFCIGVDHLGRTEGVQHHDADIVVSNMTEMGDRR
ncbi:MAG: hypothetical protein ACJ8BW_26255 [Ktedonobacteraceae bacterium]